jgi:hypothetical protein
MPKPIRRCQRCRAILPPWARIDTRYCGNTVPTSCASTPASVAAPQAPERRGGRADQGARPAGSDGRHRESDGGDRRDRRARDGQRRRDREAERVERMMARLNWSLRLPRPLVIPKVMTLTTLDDVRSLIAKHLPAHHQNKQPLRHVAAELDKAATGGDAADVSLALRMALSLEGVEWSPK